ncbi:MAG: hypothetical protein U0324_07725 [Polyangiales bacterium]
MTLSELVAVQPDWARRDPERVNDLRWEVAIQQRRRRFFSVIETFEGDRPLGRDDDEARTCDALLDQAAVYVARMVRAPRVRTPPAETAAAPVAAASPPDSPLAPAAGTPAVPVVAVAPPTQVTPPPPSAAPVVAPPTAPEPPRWAVYAGGHAAFGVLPGIAPGIQLGFSWRRRLFSVGGELRAALSQEAEVQGVTLSSGAYSVAAVGCVHPWWLGGCALATVGAVTAERLPEGTTDQSFWVAAGVRLVFDIPLPAGLHLRVRSELTANLLRAVVKTEGSPRVWSQDLLNHAHGAEIAYAW